MVGLTTIRRKPGPSISAFTCEGVPIKRKHESFIIGGRRTEQAAIAGSNLALDAATMSGRERGKGSRSMPLSRSLGARQAGMSK